MFKTQSLERYASRSLIIGTFGAILTGMIHWGVAANLQIFLTNEVIFLIVLGLIVAVITLSVWDLQQGLYVIKHLYEPHTVLAKPMAAAGISLGILDLLPAAILFMLMLENQYLQIIPLRNLLEL